MLKTLQSEIVIGRKKVDTKTTKSGAVVSIEYWDCPSCGKENTSVYVDNQIVLGGEWEAFGKNKAAGCFKGECFLDIGF